MDRSRTSNPHQQSLVGVLNAVSAFLIWGLCPIYYKFLPAVPTFEILMHRMVWSFLFLLPLILFQGRWNEFKQALKNGRTLMILLATTLIVSGNWFVFIWAINHNQILQTSLGYYINPLINILFGVVFLKERLRFAQIVAVFLAGMGVLFLTAHHGKLPWIALTLAITFGFYGLIRKVAPVSALIGLTVETFFMSMPALFYLVRLYTIGAGAFLRISIQINLILICAALVTALPLLLFTTGARMLHFSTVGVLQYIAPSATFLLAVFVYKEPFTMVQVWAFGLIWTALCIYSTESVIFYRRNRVAYAVAGENFKLERPNIIGDKTGF